MDSFQYLSFTVGGRFWYMSSTESRDTWARQRQGTGVASQGHEQDQWHLHTATSPNLAGVGLGSARGQGGSGPISWLHLGFSPSERFSWR